MNADKKNKNLDELISGAVGRDKPKFDFDKWKDEHRAEIQAFKSRNVDGQSLYSAQSLNPWRKIMKTRTAKFAAAAVIVIAVFISIHQLSGTIVGASVAWGEVAQRINSIDHVHFYKITNPENNESSFPSIREGWYAHGQLRSRSCGGYNSYGDYQSFDDGKIWKAFDRHNNVTCIGKSNLAKYRNFFEAMADGLLPSDISKFAKKTPTLVGSDFLIYDFDPPAEANWIKKISVTVGRNSLIPINIKTYYRVEKWYCTNDLLLFDYEEPEKPIEFFRQPTQTKPPHGTGLVVLGGEATEIEIHNTPGISKAIVRLHTKFDGPVEDLLIPYRERYEIMGGPVYFMEISFILDQGYRSISAKECPVWLDYGVKAALGGDNWPDGKCRNIRYTPVLRKTDKPNEFLLELSCWLRLKENDL
jgi:hypothetical protein